NNVAMYTLSMGAPFFMWRHLRFVANYINAWQREARDDDSDIEALAPWPSMKVYAHISQRTPKIIKWEFLVLYFFVPLVQIVMVRNYYAIRIAITELIAKGARSIPPLITALVVVFMTGDAWKIIAGIAFTWRFYLLITAFLLISLFFLIREDFWSDLE